jgi:hypothetical protein
VDRVPRSSTVGSLALAATLAATIILTGASSAAAATPFRFSDHVEFDDDISAFLPCDFPVRERAVLDIKGIVFTDASGEPVSEQDHFSADAWFTNGNTGVTVHDQDAFTVFFREDGSLRVVGLSFHIHLPGRGILVLTAGTVTFDDQGNVTFQAGPNTQAATQGRSLCEALA